MKITLNDMRDIGYEGQLTPFHFNCANCWGKPSTIVSQEPGFAFSVVEKPEGWGKFIVLLDGDDVDGVRRESGATFG